MTFSNFQYSRIFEALFLRSEFETVCSPIPLIAHVQNFVLRRGGPIKPSRRTHNRSKQPRETTSTYCKSRLYHVQYSAQLQTESKQRNLRARETWRTKSIGSQQFHVPHLGHYWQLGPLITCILYNCGNDSRQTNPKQHCWVYATGPEVGFVLRIHRVYAQTNFRQTNRQGIYKYCYFSFRFYEKREIIISKTNHR